MVAVVPLNKVKIIIEEVMVKIFQNEVREQIHQSISFIIWN